MIVHVVKFMMTVLNTIFATSRKMVQRALKIVLHGKFILFYENPFEGDYIVLLIKHKHGFLVVHRINGTE